MQARHLKILCLSLFVLVSAVAVSASTAQAANWKLLLNGSSVSSLKLSAEILPAHAYIADLNLLIACGGGSASVTAAAVGEKLNVSGTTTLTGCDVHDPESPEMLELCEIHSPGQPDGTIVGSGSGEANMGEGEIVTTLLVSAKFADIQIEGPECSLALFSDTVNGSIKLTLLEALKNTTVKLAHLNEDVLKYGTHSAELLGLTALLEGDEPEVLAHVRDANPTATWAIHLD